jgi:autotransporter translocation and assembly factor TamB
VAGGIVTINRGCIESPDGRADLAGTVNLADRRQLAVTVSGFDWSAVGLLPLLPDRVRPGGRLTGEGKLSGTLAAPIVTAHLKLGPGEAYDMEWQSAEAVLHWRNRLEIEYCTVAAMGTVISASGTLGASGWDLAVGLEKADLSTLSRSLAELVPWLAEEIAGSATVKVKITGPPARPVIAGDLSIDKLARGGFFCERLDARFTLADSTVSFPSLEAWAGKCRYAASGRMDLARQTVEIMLETNQGDLAGLCELAGVHAPWPIKGLVTGTIGVNGGLDDPGMSADLRFEQGMAGGVSFEGALALAYERKTLTLRHLNVVHDGGTLEAAGKLTEEDFQLNLAMRGMPLASLARLAGFEGVAEGRADMRLALVKSGPALGGDFRLEIGGGAMWAGIPVERFMAEGRIGDRNIFLTRAELLSGGHNLTAGGRIPLPGDLGRLENLLHGIPAGQERLALEVKSDGLPMAAFNPVLKDAAVFTAGNLDFDARIEGTWHQPAFYGRITVNGAAGASKLLPDPFAEMNINIRLDGREITVVKSEARLGKGTAALGGTIAITPGGAVYNLMLRARQVAYRNAFFDGRIGKMDVACKGGPMPEISGTIAVNDSIITVGASKPGHPPPPVKLNVVVTAGRDVRFLLPGVVDVPLTGELAVSGTLDAPKLSGIVSATTGTILVYGGQFDLTAGVASFTSTGGYLPYVELDGGKTIDATKVFVHAVGTISELGLNIALWSEPPLDRQEILDLLQKTSMGGTSASPAGSQLFLGGLELVMGTVFSQLSEDFRRFLDADDLQIKLDDASGFFSFEMGKFVTKELYVTYEVQFDEFSTKVWSLDYYLQPFLVLGGVFSSTESSQWSLTYTLSF